MQIICTSLQTENHASTSSLSFYKQAGCPSCRPTNSIKELKAQLTASSQTLTWHTTDQSKLKQLTMTAYQ